jgi:hypothetical protein
MTLPRLLTALFLASVGLIVSAPRAQAERLESPSYRVQFGNLNMGSGEQNSASYNLTNTTGQTAAGPFAGLTNLLGSGFQYIYTIDTFGFAISKLNIDFGTLIIGSHTTDNHTITVDAKGAGGYTIYAYELHPLRHGNGTDTIANTSCDSADCTYIVAKTWTDQSVPGFGFNATGNSIASDFLSPNYFRPFADQNASQPMQPVMQSSEIAISEQATITYKAGIAANQATGNYQTAVVFIAVPGY